MQILSPTKLQKKKLKEMILKLFPQYRYVKFGANGIISLSKSFWHILFCVSTKIHVTELCTVHIPERLEELDTRTNIHDEFVYKRAYNQYSHTVLDLLHHRVNSIIDYLYDEYTYIKYGLHKNYYTVNNTLPEITHTLSEILQNPVKKDGIVLSRLSNAYSKQALRRWKNTSFVLNHPILRSKYLDMWFKKEVKEKLKQIYNIRIVVT
jgi:hypothetical protein